MALKAMDSRWDDFMLCSEVKNEVNFYGHCFSAHFSKWKTKFFQSYILGVYNLFILNIFETVKRVLIFEGLIYNPEGLRNVKKWTKSKKEM